MFSNEVIKATTVYHVFKLKERERERESGRERVGERVGERERGE